MKNIVLFINTLSSGGAEHQLVQLADGLVKRGYKVTITTFGDADDHYSFNSSIERHLIASGKSNLVKMLSIWWYFLTLKTDCVIAFGQRESRYMLEGLYLRPFHHIRVICGDRNTTYGSPSKTEKLLMRHLYKKSDYIVPNSNAQLFHVISSEPRYKKKTVCITNYTDLSTYSVTPLPFNDIIRIGVFARYSPQKNCLRFAEAIRVLKERTNQPFVIEWFGDVMIKGMLNPYYKAFKEKIIEYGLDDVLKLNDHVKDVAERLPHYDAFCLPSLYEGFSNSVSEAICCGKPCLVSDVADNSIMVHDKKNGFLFDPTDIESIIDAFQKYFSLSEKEKIKMSIESRRIAESLFDYDRFVSSYVQLIES